jgi:methyl-accepting chemotaxis protein PixJ
VVADEVRSLARQSADATTEIAALVEEIQAETQAVSQAMEAGIQQVVAGTNLVSDTRSSLSEMVSVTAQIGSLVEGINQTAATQTQQAQAVAHTMTEVAGMADRTSADSVALAASFEELLAISQELQSSVGRFKVN